MSCKNEPTDSHYIFSLKVIMLIDLIACMCSGQGGEEELKKNGREFRAFMTSNGGMITIKP